MPNFKVFDDLLHDMKTMPIEYWVEEAVNDVEDEMADMNVEQMNAGIDSDGNDIEPEYSPVTVAIKKKAGKVYDRVTLRDTGDFQDKIRVKRYPKKRELYSFDKKSEKLQDKYGYQILGLTDANMGRIRMKMKPLIARDVRQYFKHRKK